MAALGSLYLVWATDEEIFIYGKSKAPRPVSSQSHRSEQPPLSRGRASTVQCSPTRITQEKELFPRLSSDQNALQIIPTITEPVRGSSPDEHIEHAPVRVETAKSESNAGRGKVRSWLEKASVYMSDAAHRELDTSDYRDEKARRYPWIPGEELRNDIIHRTSTNYDKNRAASYASSIRSANEVETASTPPAEKSPQPDTSPDAITSAPVRRPTLEVPPVAYHSAKLPQRKWSS